MMPRFLGRLEDRNDRSCGDKTLSKSVNVRIDRGPWHELLFARQEISFGAAVRLFPTSLNNSEIGRRLRSAIRRSAADERSIGPEVSPP